MKKRSSPVSTNFSCGRAAMQNITRRNQAGVILFVTLIALLAIMLAAVALIRAVDTGTLIAGNISFKQATTSSGDARLTDAVNWLNNQEAANAGKNVLNDPTHTLNNSVPAQGYYSYMDNRSLLPPTSILTPHFDWSDADSSPETIDPVGNRQRYIIQRMCSLVDAPVQTPNECLFGGAPQLDTSNQTVPYPADKCDGPGCPVAGQSPQYRITVRSTGIKNTTSYIQLFVY